MKTARTIGWDLKETFEIVVLLATAVVMTAAAFDVASVTEAPGTPAVEREAIPNADRMTSSEFEAYRRRMQAAAAPEEKAKIRAEYANAATKGMPAGQLVGDPAKGALPH